MVSETRLTIPAEMFHVASFSNDDSRACSLPARDSVRSARNGGKRWWESFRLRVYLRRTSLAVALLPMKRLASSVYYNAAPSYALAHVHTIYYYPRLKEITNRPRLRPRTNGNHSRERIEEVEREGISRRDGGVRARFIFDNIYYIHMYIHMYIEQAQGRGG